MNAGKSSPLPIALAAAILLAAAGLYALLRQPSALLNVAWEGMTMGTSYRVKLVDSPLRAGQVATLKASIEAYLVNLNKQLSTYDPSSEISRFNQSTSLAPFRVSPEFARLAAFAIDLNRRSGGALDPTLGPVIDLWGFGANSSVTSPPPDAAIRAAEARTGCQHLNVPDSTSIRKDIADLQINLNAVAEGCAVDALVRMVTATGCSNAYIEIGGEIAVLGHSAGGGPWRLGIETPAYGSLPGQLPGRGVILAQNMAVAASGDYRNYFESEGRVYSHIMDPRTGRPVTNQHASATVIAPTCMLADGLATTLMVLDVSDGLRLIADTPGTEALVIVREGRNYREYESEGFKRYRDATVGPKSPNSK